VGAKWCALNSESNLNNRKEGKGGKQKLRLLRRPGESNKRTAHNIGLPEVTTKKKKKARSTLGRDRTWEEEN